MDDDMEIEIIEVEEPEEPVPMQDCCLQVRSVLALLLTSFLIIPNS